MSNLSWCEIVILSHGIINVIRRQPDKISPGTGPGCLFYKDKSFILFLIPAIHGHMSELFKFYIKKIKPALLRIINEKRQQM